MTDYLSILQSIQRDARYLENLDWGEPRDGHPEGTIRAHIAELEANLLRLRDRVSGQERVKLQVLIHVHDTFKPQSAPAVAITNPHSHASLARLFLAEFCDDGDLLAMTQFHDEPFALWRQFYHKGGPKPDRVAALLAAITDWDVFNAFVILDASSQGKAREPIRWWLEYVADKVRTRFTVADALE